MAISFGHFLSSLLLLAFLDCFECRATISNEESIKMPSTKYHADDLVQVMLHSLHGRFSLENQNSNKHIHWEPTYDDDGNTDSQILTRLALASQVQGEYYGVQATMDVYNLPEVGQNQSSSAMMCLINKDISGEENMIVVGWHVYPKLYGDHYAHFFMLSEGRQQICLNLKCQDFVLDKSSKIVPGSAIQQSSGRGQNITLKISKMKNESSGDWWLYYGDKAVGRWPKSVFSSLEESANVIGWGGQVFYEENQKSPPMGSGHLPSEGKEKAASMSDINIMLRNGELVAPKYDDHVEEDGNCYEISTGDVIFYGGPGGCKE